MEGAPDDGGEPGREVPQLSEDFVAEVPEEVRHRLEVKVDETVDDPCYGTPVSQIAQQEEVSHGSQGSHVDPSVPTVGSTAGGQRPVPTELDVTSLQTALESGRGERVRQVSPEQRKEDVSQISRSLQYMTGLLTNLVTRVDRVEQRQSTSGSVAPQSTDEGSQMTPSAATPALHPSWDQVDRLGGQMSALTFGSSGPSLGAGPPPGMEWRPLAPMSRMMEGTFSSDSSGTARRRMEEALRGVPGALLGPLAGVNIPLALDGLPIGEDWRQPMEVDGVPLREHGTSELSSMSRPQPASQLPSMSRPQQASELSSMSRPQQASELSSNVKTSTGLGAFKYVKTSTGIGAFKYVKTSTGIGAFKYVKTSAGIGASKYVKTSTGIGAVKYVKTSAGIGAFEYAQISAGIRASKYVWTSVRSDASKYAGVHFAEYASGVLTGCWCGGGIKFVRLVSCP